jgi:hypothetical protein
MAAIAFAVAQESDKAATAPDITGTYKLVSSTLADGTKLTPPNAQGLLTFTGTHRNFNVVVKPEDGNVSSYSVVSTYKLDGKQYSETLLYSVMVDQSKSPTPVYNFSSETKTVPVEMMDGAVSIEMPFDFSVKVKITESILTATSPDFTDYWEKID